MSRRSNGESAKQKVVDEIYNIVVPNLFRDNPATREIILNVLENEDYSFFKPISYILALYGNIIENSLYESRKSPSCSIDNIIKSIPIDELANDLYKEAPKYVHYYFDEHQLMKKAYYKAIKDIRNEYFLNHPDYKKFKTFMCTEFVLDEDSTHEEIGQQLGEFAAANDF